MANEIVEDQTYVAAQQAVAAGLAQKKIGMHGNTDEAAKVALGDDVSVKFDGAPHSLSFSQRVRNSGSNKTADGKISTGDNRENLSMTITPSIDLRAANDADVKAAVFETVKTLMSCDNFKYDIQGKDGQPKTVHLADAFDWKGDAPHKITPKLDIVDGVRHGNVSHEIHLFLDLPAGVTHWGAVDAIAGKDPLKLKSAPAAEAAPAVTSEASATASETGATAQASTTTAAPAPVADEKVQQVTTAATAPVETVPAETAAETKKWADEKLQQVTATATAEKPASFAEAHTTRTAASATARTV